MSGMKPTYGYIAHTLTIMDDLSDRGAGSSALRLDDALLGLPPYRKGLNVPLARKVLA